MGKVATMTDQEYTAVACRIFGIAPDLLTPEQRLATKKGVFYALYGGRLECPLPISPWLFIDPARYLEKLQAAVHLLAEGSTLAEVCDNDVAPEAVVAIAAVDRLLVPDLRTLVRGMR